MPKVTIAEKGCRSCTLCVDVCPTSVFEMEDGEGIAQVKQEDDCIGCTSCLYICPSRCITLSDVELQRPFHRIENNSSIVARFVQQPTMMAQLQEADFQEAKADVSVRLHSLVTAAQEILGRAMVTAGRKSGTVAATHFPELYETTELKEILARLKARFRNSFDFEPEVKGAGSVCLRFSGCAIGRVVKEQGEQVGKATMCVLYHEYWAGLLGTLTDKKYGVRLDEAGDRCVFELTPRT